MAAVVVSMGVMLFASKPLTRFVNAHPTVVVLCLSFLLMIGLSLIAEGFGEGSGLRAYLDMPKYFAPPSDCQQYCRQSEGGLLERSHDKRNRPRSAAEPAYVWGSKQVVFLSGSRHG